LLPPIPDKLWRIDESTVEQHFSLKPSDQCYYVWEYTANKRYDFSPTNQLITNLKIPPSEIQKRGRWKTMAIKHCAAALKKLVSERMVRERATFIPVPGSKAKGHPDYDDRNLQVLVEAFGAWNMDLCDILELTQSTESDHSSRGDRIAFHDLLSITRVRELTPVPAHSIIILVDDVLNSGRHFKVAQQLLSVRYPQAEIRGLFMARCIRETPIEFDLIPEDFP
jgi:hypothetical protein